MRQRLGLLGAVRVNMRLKSRVQTSLDRTASCVLLLSYRCSPDEALEVWRDSTSVLDHRKGSDDNFRNDRLIELTIFAPPCLFPVPRLHEVARGPRRAVKAAVALMRKGELRRFLYGTLARQRTHHCVIIIWLIVVSSSGEVPAFGPRPARTLCVLAYRESNS